MHIQSFTSQGNLSCCCYCICKTPQRAAKAATAAHLDCVNVFCAGIQTKFLEHEVAAWLQQLSNNAIRLRQVALQQQHPTALLQQHTARPCWRCYRPNTMHCSNEAEGITHHGTMTAIPTAIKVVCSEGVSCSVSRSLIKAWTLTLPCLYASAEPATPAPTTIKSQTYTTAGVSHQQRTAKAVEQSWMLAHLRITMVFIV